MNSDETISNQIHCPRCGKASLRTEAAGWSGEGGKILEGCIEAGEYSSAQSSYEIETGMNLYTCPHCHTEFGVVA